MTSAWITFACFYRNIIDNTLNVTITNKYLVKTLTDLHFHSHYLRHDYKSFLILKLYLLDFSFNERNYKLLWKYDEAVLLLG